MAEVRVSFDEHAIALLADPDRAVVGDELGNHQRGLGR
jgi:hypothetical protein